VHREVCCRRPSFIFDSDQDGRQVRRAELKYMRFTAGCFSSLDNRGVEVLLEELSHGNVWKEISAE
jgi:hypothetical protein